MNYSQTCTDGYASVLSGDEVQNGGVNDANKLQECPPLGIMCGYSTTCCRSMHFVQNLCNRHVF